MRFYRDRSAVVLRVKPTELAKRVYGSSAAATSVLGLRENAFHHYDRTNRIPYSVYQSLLTRDAAISSDVVSVETVRAKPFKVPYALKPQVATASRRPSKTAKDSKAKPSSRIADQVSQLERENASLRRTLERIRAFVER
jgi:hypothetical protein